MANSDALASLLTRATAGDRSVLLDLINHSRMEMVARLRSRPHENEAEDVFQDALVQAIQRLDQFNWHGWEAFQAWLWAFVEHAHADRRKYHTRDCRDQRRVVKDLPRPSADSSPVGVLAGMASGVETPSRQVRRQERDCRLRLAMRDALTDDQRLAIELRYFEFLPVDEVRRHTGWTESKVKMLCRRGLDRLREVLTESMCSSGTS